MMKITEFIFYQLFYNRFKIIGESVIIAKLPHIFLFKKKKIKSFPRDKLLKVRHCIWHSHVGIYTYRWQCTDRKS